MRDAGGMGGWLSRPQIPNLLFSKHLQDRCNLAREFATMNKQVFGQYSLRMTILQNLYKEQFPKLGSFKKFVHELYRDTIKNANLSIWVWVCKSRPLRKCE